MNCSMPKQEPVRHDFSKIRSYMALPNLIVGDDVTIYAVNNTGRTYKLGYIAGVNTCGLIFFGYVFWRARRLRHHLRQGQ